MIRYLRLFFNLCKNTEIPKALIKMATLIRAKQISDTLNESGQTDIIVMDFSKAFDKAVTYIIVTRNSNEIPILNKNNTVMYLTQVNEGNSISFIYTIGFYRCFGIHSVISLLFT